MEQREHETKKRTKKAITKARQKKQQTNGERGNRDLDEAVVVVIGGYQGEAAEKESLEPTGLTVCGFAGGSKDNRSRPFS